MCSLKWPAEDVYLKSNDDYCSSICASLGHSGGFPIAGLFLDVEPECRFHHDEAMTCRKPQSQSSGVRWRFLCFLLCVCPIPHALNAQHWGESLYNDAEVEWAKASFDSTWADSTAERGKGVKPFLRWWHFARKRWAYPESPFGLPADILWKETAEERAGRRARISNPPPFGRSCAFRASLDWRGGAGEPRGD